MCSCIDCNRRKGGRTPDAGAPAPAAAAGEAELDADAHAHRREDPLRRVAAVPAHRGARAGGRSRRLTASTGLAPGGAVDPRGRRAAKGVRGDHRDTRGTARQRRAAADSVRRRQGRRRQDVRRGEPRHHARARPATASWRSTAISRAPTSTPRSACARPRSSLAEYVAEREEDVRKLLEETPIPNLRLIAATRPNLANPQPSHALRVALRARAAHARRRLRVHRPRRGRRRDRDGLLHGLRRRRRRDRARADLGRERLRVHARGVLPAAQARDALERRAQGGRRSRWTSATSAASARRSTCCAR